MIWVKRSEKHDSFYLYSYFVSPIFREYLLSISHTGTIAHYTIEQVKKTPVFFPSLEEQQKIGVYFSNLDHLITLHYGSDISVSGKLSLYLHSSKRKEESQ